MAVAPIAMGLVSLRENMDCPFRRVWNVVAVDPRMRRRVKDAVSWSQEVPVNAKGPETGPFFAALLAAAAATR
jgi:hypothetical protein